MSSDSLLRLSDVKARSTLSHPTIYRLIQAGKFPPPVKIGGITRWHSADIEAWIASFRRGGNQPCA